MITLFFSLLALYFSARTDAFVFLDGCPSVYCNCQFETLNLTIKCNQQASSPLQLPDNNVYFFLVNTQYLVLRDSFLSQYPRNLCKYSDSLVYLSLMNNLIFENLTNSYFDCLNNLDYLSLSNNFIINIAENSFDNMRNLRTLDLSYNKISSIPFKLFYLKFPYLTTLNLRYNYLIEIDSSLISLKTISNIDLSYNSIVRFTNKISWNPSTSTSTANNILDLRYNNLASFDDSVLKLFSVCSQEDLAQFVTFFRNVLISNNPLECNCINSYNLLRFYQNYISIYPGSIVNTLFLAKCFSPAQFNGSSIFSFINSTTCASTSIAFENNNCNSTKTTTTTQSSQVAGLVAQSLITAPTLNLTEKILSGVYDSQTAGIVVGFSGVLIIFLILLYCICPIEILAVCFNCIPFFYTICPCKSGVKREKEYDLFISYNQTNQKWIENKLIPFIKEKYLIENYILHYNSENKIEEVFGSYIKDIMNKSSCILFILSDAFLLKEWNNKEFRQHLRYLITKEKTRFICVQMHDICDEEVEEYFTEKLQIPRFVSLENDEFLFWPKLAYFLYTNNNQIERVLPVPPPQRPEYFARPNYDIDFDKHKINRPIIHLHGSTDPYNLSKPHTVLTSIPKSRRKSTDEETEKMPSRFNNKVWELSSLQTATSNRKIPPLNFRRDSDTSSTASFDLPSSRFILTNENTYEQSPKYQFTDSTQLKKQFLLDEINEPNIEKKKPWYLTDYASKNLRIRQETISDEDEQNLSKFQRIKLNIFKRKIPPKKSRVNVNNLRLVADYTNKNPYMYYSYN